MREKGLKALIALGAVLLLSLSLWGIAAAQDDPEGTPESTPEATAEAAATERPFLGVRLEDVDGAVVIREVVAGSPAAEARLEVSDEITAINESEVSSAGDVVDAISALAPGDEVTIEYSRDGETGSAQATLGSAPAQDDFSRGQGRGGRGFRGMLGDLSISYSSDDQSWTIESLSEDSPLYEAGLREGDVITAFNGEPYDPASLMQFLMAQDENITLTVERDGEEQEIEISASDLQMLGMGGMFRFGEGFDMPFGEGHGMPFGQGRGMMPDMMPFHMFAGNGWLGITYVNLDEQTAEEQGVDVTEGALVTEVVADSPAEAGGLQVDDVITGVNGEAVDEEHTLRDRLIAYEPGDTVTLDVLRGGETQQIEVTLGEPTGMAGMMPFFEFGDIPGDLIPAVPAPEATTEPNV